MTKPNYAALIEYLASAGIDAMRIPEDQVTAESYTYWPDRQTERVIYGSDPTNPVGTQFNLTWPTKEFGQNVITLMAGGSIDDILEKQPAMIVNDPETDEVRKPRKVTAKDRKTEKEQLEAINSQEALDALNNPTGPDKEPTE
jgi:hypothetical protein